MTKEKRCTKRLPCPYLGSQAKNKFHEHSDIDIAVHSQDALSYDSLAKMQVELSLLCKREIDIADLSKAEGLFLHQIMTTGERIKFNHDVFHKYIMKALYFYEDFLPIQRARRAEKIKRFVNGDASRGLASCEGAWLIN